MRSERQRQIWAFQIRYQRTDLEQLFITVLPLRLTFQVGYTENCLAMVVIYYNFATVFIYWDNRLEKVKFNYHNATASTFQVVGATTDFKSPILFPFSTSALSLLLGSPNCSTNQGALPWLMQFSPLSRNTVCNSTGFRVTSVINWINWLVGSSGRALRIKACIW